jgi:hypothetical protein
VDDALLDRLPRDGRPASDHEGHRVRKPGAAWPPTRRGVDNPARRDYPRGVGAVVICALLAAGRIVVTEVMANPAGKSGSHYPEDRNEFVELYNPTDSAIDLLGWVLSDGDAEDRLTAWTDSSILNNCPALRIGRTWLYPGCYAVVLDSEYTDPAPLGGFVQPYRFGDSALILTTGNTTLGNGLATSDPVTLTSPSAYEFRDTSTFGTPWNTTDSLPCDPGDGISWERIDPRGPDTASNWLACPDGCTPGAPNTALSYVDMAVTGLALRDSATGRPGDNVACVVTVSNPGFPETDSWRLSVFIDHNSNGREDAGENVFDAPGWRVRHGVDSALAFRFPCPPQRADLWARLACDEDRDTTNNALRLSIAPGGASRLLDLNLSTFSPDGDGFEDSVAVLYRLPEPGGRLDISVFDMAGREVKRLYSGKPADVAGVAWWDGSASSGRRPAMGIYLVCVSYRAGGSTRAGKLPVVLVRR